MWFVDPFRLKRSARLVIESVQKDRDGIGWRSGERVLMDRWESKMQNRFVSWTSKIQVGWGLHVCLSEAASEESYITGWRSDC
jgi:hypothetical protein